MSNQLGVLKKISSFVGNIRIRNWRIVLLCIAVASLFKLLTSLNKDYTTTIYYPIEFVFDHGNVVVMRDLPDEVYLNVSGGGWNLLRKTLALDVDPLKIVLTNPTDINKITGASLVHLVAEQIKDIQLNYVVTDTLFITIEPKVSRTFRVFVDSATIDLEENHFITSNISVQPDSIEIIGPVSLVNTHSDSIIISINEKEIDNNFSEIVGVPFSRLDVTNRVPDEVKVDFEVNEFEYKVKNIRPALANFPTDSSVFPLDTLVQVKYYSPSGFDEAKFEQPFKVLVDLEEANPSDSTILPRLVGYPGQIILPTLDTTRLKVQYVK